MKFRSINLIAFLLLANGNNYFALVEGRAVTDPCPNDTDWVDCVGGFDRKSPCLLNGGTCSVRGSTAGTCITGGTVLTPSPLKSCSSVGATWEDNFGNCIDIGVTVLQDECKTCEAACGGDCCFDPLAADDYPCRQATACIKRDESCTGDYACNSVAYNSPGKPAISGPSCVGEGSCGGLGSDAVSPPDFITKSCTCTGTSCEACDSLGIGTSIGNVLSSCNGDTACASLCAFVPTNPLYNVDLCVSGLGSLNGSCNGDKDANNRGVCQAESVIDQQVCIRNDDPVKIASWTPRSNPTSKYRLHLQKQEISIIS